MFCKFQLLLDAFEYFIYTLIHILNFLKMNRNLFFNYLKLNKYKFMAANANTPMTLQK